MGTAGSGAVRRAKAKSTVSADFRGDAPRTTSLTHDVGQRRAQMSTVADKQQTFNSGQCCSVHIGQSLGVVGCGDKS